MHRSELRQAISSILVGSTLAASAAAQTPAGSDLEEIVVVGSAIGIRETEAESQAVPIEVLGAEDIAASGQFTVGELLRTQPAFSGASGAIEGDGTGRQTLNLRGLGDVYTLTLLNGRRFSVNGPANVAAIPAAAIERVEVLKAGASGLYGSDAVTGVVNLILRQSHEGFGFDASYGSGADGYDTQDYSVYFGGTGETGRFFVLANYHSNGSIAAVDRRVVASNDQRALGGLDGRSDANNPGTIVFGNFDAVLTLDRSRVPRGGSSLNPADYKDYDFDGDRYDRRPDGQYAFAPSERTSVIFNGVHEFGERTELTGTFLYNRTTARNVTGTSTIFAEVPATNPHNPFGQDVGVFWRPFPPQFGDTGAIEERAIDSVSGSLALAHGFGQGWKFQLTTNVFREADSLDRPNAYLDSALREALASSSPDALDPFCNRCNPDSRYEGVIVGLQTDRTTTLMEADARVTGEAFTLPTGTVQTAFGLYAREERFDFDPDRLLTAELATDEGVAFPQDLTRTVKAAFAEVRVPLLRERNGAGTSPLELGLAARYEDFSDVGGTFDPLVSLRAEVVPDWLTLRASYNTSFRAPALEDLTAARFPEEVTVFDPVANDLVDAIAFRGGNAQLDPETARTFSIGAVLQPAAAEDLLVALDYWRIKQSDVIVNPDPQAVVNGVIPGTVTRGDNIGQGGEDLLIEALLTNVAEREAEGLDLLASYTRSLGDTRLDLDVSATYLLSFGADVLDGRGLVDEAGTYSLGFGGLPEFKATSGLTVSRGPFSGRVEVNYIGSYDDSLLGGAFTTPRTIDAVTYVDLSLRWRPEYRGALLRGLTLGVGVENVTDEEPPFVRATNTFDPGQHDIRGRYWHASVSANF